MVVPNFWHDETEYRESIKKAGLVVEQEFAELLPKERRAVINTGVLAEKTLGPTYEQHPAFRVFLIKRPKR